MKQKWMDFILLDEISISKDKKYTVTCFFLLFYIFPSLLFLLFGPIHFFVPFPLLNSQPVSQDF